MKRTYYATIASVSVGITFITTLFISCSHHQKAAASPKACSAEFFDTRTGKKPVSYIYAPGLMGSEILMGRYCPEFTASTGEKITWLSGGNVIGQPHSAVIFPEIDLKKPARFSLNPVTYFLNSIRRDLTPLIQRYFEDTFKFTIEDNPTSTRTVAGYTFNFWNANIAQRKDIRALQKAYTRHRKCFPNTHIVLYGDSRGAATIFNFIAAHRPKGVKAAILEGIFDDVQHCIKHFLYSDKDKRSEDRLHSLLGMIMRSYKPDGPSPRKYAEHITDDIPLLLVTSLNDGIVPPQCTLWLYKKLIERGHQNVHLLVLSKASHPCYMISDSDDKNTYEHVVHAFYKYYGLPHNHDKAIAGAAAFATTQPSAAELAERYALPACTRCGSLVLQPV